MKIKELRYERKFFLGEFQTEGLGVMAELGEGEDPKVKMAELRNFIESEGTFGRQKFQTLNAKKQQVLNSQVLTDKLKNATVEAQRRKGRKTQILPQQEKPKGN